MPETLSFVSAQHDKNDAYANGDDDDVVDDDDDDNDDDDYDADDYDDNRQCQAPL